jgi:hypothetical protein
VYLNSGVSGFAEHVLYGKCVLDYKLYTRIRNTIAPMHGYYTVLMLPAGTLLPGGWQLLPRSDVPPHAHT